jgi:hypothetical protein
LARQAMAAKIVARAGGAGRLKSVRMGCFSCCRSNPSCRGTTSGRLQRQQGGNF